MEAVGVEMLLEIEGFTRFQGMSWFFDTLAKLKKSNQLILEVVQALGEVHLVP